MKLRLIRTPKYHPFSKAEIDCLFAHEHERLDSRVMPDGEKLVKIAVADVPGITSFPNKYTFWFAAEDFEEVK